ncbi:MAG: hypothetical protein ACE5GY_07140 [Thermodesulfobacteriota bacterium]
MGSCLEKCVYKANEEGEWVNPETGLREVWCAKHGKYVLLNDNPCPSFMPREG